MMRVFDRALEEAWALIRQEHTAVSACYSDGGVAGPNPSAIGGMWAYVLTDEHGTVVRQRAGIVVTESAPLPLRLDDYVASRWMQPTISNNQTELYALVRALRMLPDGWAGTFYCDSQNALYRAFGGWRLTNVPHWLATAMGEEVRRLGAVRPVLLAGHPTTRELQTGYKTKPSGRLPVSVHNVACDRLCNAARAAYDAALVTYGAAPLEEPRDSRELRKQPPAAPAGQLALPV